MDAITVDGQDVTAEGQRTAIVDSGTSLLVGTDEAVKTITDALNATVNFAGEYFVDCDATLPTMVRALPLVGGVVLFREGARRPKLVTALAATLAPLLVRSVTLPC